MTRPEGSTPRSPEERGPDPIGSHLSIRGPIARADVPRLCERAGDLLAGCHEDTLVCDLAEIREPDAVAVEAVARLQLTVRRAGKRLRCLDAGPGLRELVALMGLDGVLPLDPPLHVEPRRQAEQREQARGVQEEGDPRDPVA